jgi:hypothetical protein
MSQKSREPGQRHCGDIEQRRHVPATSVARFNKHTEPPMTGSHVEFSWSQVLKIAISAFQTRSGGVRENPGTRHCVVTLEDYVCSDTGGDA